MDRDSKGYGFGIGAALAALIVVCVGFGLYVGALAGPPEQGGASHRNRIEQGVKTPPINAALPKVPRSKDYNPPCSQGTDDRESDLCAQWKAADSAYESSVWTRVSSYVAIAAAVISFLTLLAASFAAWFARQAARHTETGAKAAQAAVNETRRIGEAQVRSYLSIIKAEIRFNVKGQVDVRLQIKNSGQSPAQRLQMQCWVTIKPLKEKTPDQNLYSAAKDLTASIAAGNTVTFPPLTPATPVRTEFMEAVIEGHPVAVVLMVVIEWRDVFHAKRSLSEGYSAVSVEWPFEEFGEIPHADHMIAAARREGLRRGKRKPGEDEGNHPPPPRRKDD